MLNIILREEFERMLHLAKVLKKKSKLRKVFLLFTLVFLIAAFAFLYVEIKLTPIVKTMALQKAKSIAAYVVSDAVYEETRESLDYEDLVTFEKDNNGKVTALKTNIVYINRLKSLLSVKILEKLQNIPETELYIPLGTALNKNILSGMGPKIRVELIPIGSVTTDIKNVFSSAGINQSRHQIMMETRVTVAIVMPMSSVSEDIVSSVCIAETVIVGDVPEAYTNVERENDEDTLTGDLIDFKA